MLQKIKNFLSKKQNAIVAGVGVASALAVNGFCEVDNTAITAVTTGFTGLKDTVVAGIGAVAPVALTVAGLILLWRYGMKIFKIVSK